MGQRLKKWRAGALLNLLEGDLLIAAFFPHSIKVHLAKFIVTKDGHLECAEWITGSEEGRFRHNAQPLNPSVLASLRNALNELGKVVATLDLDQLDFDVTAYEQPERLALRFRYDNQETRPFLLNDAFFTDFAIDEQQKKLYAKNFHAVTSCLPLDWVTQAM